jgi:hypothetical protein
LAQGSDKHLGLEAGFYYTVKKGDTLWDISHQFFDEAWLWPDLWRNNQHIKNPHIIDPGTLVHLYLGRGRKVEPIVAPPAESFFYYYAQIDQVGFMRKKPIDAVGSIIKVRDDKEMISKDDLVYIKPADKAQLAPGTRHTLYRTIVRQKNVLSGSYIGTQHYLVGIAEIIKQEPKFALARITHSFREIKVGDLLTPHEPRSPKITIVESKAGINGKVVGSEEWASIFGTKDIVFIDKGQNDGLAVGQQYDVVVQDKMTIGTRKKEILHLSRYDIGSVLVLRTEPAFSTVLITYIEREISPDADVSSPEP